jgi:hypothetical protein
MLTQAVIQTSIPMTLDIESVDPDEILILKSISGLSKAGADLFMGDFARDGSYYQGRRAKQRNPVFNFKVNPDYVNDVEASDIREMLYAMFMEPQAATDAVQVLLKDDRKPDRYFIGYTEDIEADQFSKELSATVSMLCTDPYLRSAAETTETTPGGWLNKTLTYEGSADTGLELTLKVQVTTPTVIVNINGVLMTLTSNFVANDIITINTSAGSRKIQKNGIDIMVSLSAASKWLMLRERTNVIQVYGAIVGDSKVVATMYKYRAAWWGV